MLIKIHVNLSIKHLESTSTNYNEKFKKENRKIQA